MDKKWPPNQNEDFEIVSPGYIILSNGKFIL